MTPSASWFLLLALTPVVFLLLTWFLGAHAYKEENKKRYSLLTMFPYEMLEGGSGAKNATRVSYYFYLAASAFAGSYLLLTLDKHTYLLPLAIVVLVFFVLQNVALLALGLISAYNPKQHLLAYVAYSGLSVLAEASSAVTFANLMPVDSSLALGFCVAMVAFAAIHFLLLVNPRLSHWGELRSTMDEQGNVTTYRPKPFVLAFSEHLALIFSLVSTIVGLLGFLLLNLK